MLQLNNPHVVVEYRCCNIAKNGKLFGLISEIQNEHEHNASIERECLKRMFSCSTFGNQWNEFSWFGDICVDKATKYRYNDGILTFSIENENPICIESEILIKSQFMRIEFSASKKSKWSLWINSMKIIIKVQCLEQCQNGIVKILNDPQNCEIK